MQELARETASATEQIELGINDIQSDTKSAAIVIQFTGDIISRISAIQSSIASAIDQHASVAEDMGRSAVKVVTGNKSVSAVMEHVAEKAVSNQQASDDISTTASELPDTAVELQRLIARFTGDHTQQHLFARVRAA